MPVESVNAQRYPWVDVTRYGAVGDGVADDTFAITASINRVVSAGGGFVYIPSGTYRITSTLDARGNSVGIVGDGVGVTSIKQATDNAPILKLGGKHVSVKNMDLHYENVQDDTNTDANAIECTNMWMSQIDNVSVYNVGRALYQPQDEGDNYFFSNNIHNLKVYLHSQAAIHLKPVNFGNTGSIFTNIHIDCDIGGGVVGSVSEPPVYLESCSGMVFDRLNVEWSKSTNTSGLGFGVIKLRDSQALFRSLYMEGTQSVVDGGAWIEALGPTAGSQVVIDGWQMGNCACDDAAVFTFGIVKINDASTSVTVKRYLASSITTTGTYYTFLKGAYASNQVVVLDDTPVLPTVDDMEFMTGSAPVVPTIRKYGERWYAWQENTMRVITGSSAPASGTWVQGDRVMNTAPTSGGNIGWVCTTGGTPGTWKTWGTIA